MTDLSMTTPGGLGSTAQSRSLLAIAAAGAAFATLVNAALWAGGRAADVSFSVTLALGDTVHRISIFEVVLATPFLFAVGWGLLALAARRSRRWVRAVLGAAVLVAVISAGGSVTAANDTATGVLLAAMHLVAAGVFLVVASRVVTKPAGA